MGSSVASGTSCNSNSLEKLHLNEEPSSKNEENLYDLPPSYEEALGTDEAKSTYRYCEIDDLVEESNSEEMCATYYSPAEKAESPIYAVIEDIIPSTKDVEGEMTENNVSSDFIFY